MSAPYLRLAINRFFERIEESEPLFEILESLSNHYGEMTPQLSEIARIGNVPNHGATLASEIYGKIGGVIAASSGVDNWGLFKSLDQFEKELLTLKNAAPEYAGLIGDLLKKVKDFGGLYNGFLQDKVGANAAQLLIAAVPLWAETKTFLEMLRAFPASSGSNSRPSSEETELSLVFPSDFNLREFSERLIALQSIYSELCSLLSVSETDFPLRIGSLEYGSLWTTVFGESTVIGLMTSFLKRAAGWTYRTFTTEGKIGSLPRKVDAIDAILELSKRLEAQGINNIEMKPHIEKAAICLSQELSALMRGQTSVTVNGDTQSVSGALEQLLVEGSQPKRLGMRGATVDERPTSEEQD